eukprot:Clim_evm41s6 gene=Clim_evmTU41s6
MNRVYELALLPKPDTPERLAADKKSIQEILQFVEVLQQVDTNGVEPMTNPLELYGSNVNALQQGSDDFVKDGDVMPRSTLMGQSRFARDEYYQYPQGAKE